jgi:hypothetical protein
MLKGLVAFDVAGLAVSLVRHSGLGHGAHLGGVLCGYAFYKAYLESRVRRRPRPWGWTGRA